MNEPRRWLMANAPRRPYRNSDRRAPRTVVGGFRAALQPAGGRHGATAGIAPSATWPDVAAVTSTRARYAYPGYAGYRQQTEFAKAA